MGQECDFFSQENKRQIVFPASYQTGHSDYSNKRLKGTHERILEKILQETAEIYRDGSPV
jgi:hypothetical protein